MPEIPLNQLDAPSETACSTDSTVERADASLEQGGGPSVYLETFGCQMNVLDSQLVTGQLRALGYRFIDDWKSADVVLYNTCSVREVAENKVWSRVGKYGKYQNALAKEGRADEGPSVLGVIGCMAERDGEDMVRKHPQVDLLCGPGELDKVPMLIDNVLKTRIEDRGGLASAQIALQGNTHRRSGTLAAAEDQLELVDLSRSFAPDESLAGGKSAYVRITRGCNKLCTYCVVPHTRGAEVHRPPQHILDECKKLVDAGVREITLLGQTVNHYHYDSVAAVEVNGVLQPQVGTVISPNQGTGGPSPVFNDTTTSFAELLHRIHEEVTGLERLRFVTNFPRDFGNDILQVIRDSPRICRYLHLPVQSGSNRILKLMNRGYKVEHFYDLIDRVREYLPDAELATDIICGFPTETEEDHQQTAELLRRCRFKNSFIFKYSPRPGTTAIDRFEDNVTDAEKKRRNNELLAIQSEVSASIHEGYVGKTVKVFVEQISAKSQKSANAADPAVTLGWQGAQTVTQLSGRTDGDLIVMFDADPSLIGQLVEVEVTSAAALALFGQVKS
ncbi:MiaB/RimO family radical SAM methylthiotransferase [Algisphaera agarilytica]|uniref:tRNA-2-methylthio-N(6)-dimethylallyladenosine synthase n=1 Tax=Algisphaera agarilytica TaxID=1385975 RepID=A0A7X0H8G3_9BACT|nr:MiaB/RimO family radical SAM methylthiotransferase [Algisphaera agarilytica]MBB6431171.1 tRNA-2-methylthio-N6-dimethylallyladenosine synthase [Algisphaera agarilytica]